jgi:hypothetical protein
VSILPALLVILAPAASPPARHEQSFELSRPSEVVAAITAGCEACAWGKKGREAATLVLSVDGRYSQHLVLARGEGPEEYRVLLGALEAGPHRLHIALDRKFSARGVGRVSVERVAFEPTPPGAKDHVALAHAPILHARPNTIGAFTDLPLLMWYETEPTARGTRIRYSVVFSNEDGGTPPDRLMATWGRLTDIEFVYGVELDGGGRILEESYQARDHKILPFAGRREGRHPLLWVVTDNNMLADRGATAVRYVPAPIPFDLSGVSREAVMDANPWTYRVSSEEARREGRVSEGARPGSRKVPDPRRFAYLEACAETEDTEIAFAVGVARSGGAISWHASDGGRPDFRISRSPDHFPNGCFRGAVALPPGTGAEELRGLRARAFTRRPRKGEPPLPPGSGRARLARVNTLFLLGADDMPGASLFSWEGDAPLAPEGPAHELALKSSREGVEEGDRGLIEVARVARHEGQLMRQRRGGDQHVGLRSGDPLAINLHLQPVPICRADPPELGKRLGHGRALAAAPGLEVAEPRAPSRGPFLLPPGDLQRDPSPFARGGADLERAAQGLAAGPHVPGRFRLPVAPATTISFRASSPSSARPSPPTSAAAGPWPATSGSLPLRRPGRSTPTSPSPASAGPAPRHLRADLRLRPDCPARQNFLIEKGGARPVRYRYHPLLRAFLRQRAHAALPAGELANHQRRAALFWSRGETLRRPRSCRRRRGTGRASAP